MPRNPWTVLSSRDQDICERTAPCVPENRAGHHPNDATHTERIGEPHMPLVTTDSSLVLRLAVISTLTLSLAWSSGCGGRAHALAGPDAGGGGASGTDHDGSGPGLGDSSSDIDSLSMDAVTDVSSSDDAESGVGEDGPADGGFAANCGTPPEVANGSVAAPTITVGSIATYSCNANFTFSPPAAPKTRTCEATGRWSGAPPVCVDICTLGGAGTASHCCDSTACPPTTPVCGSDHACAPIVLGKPCAAPNQCASGYCVGASAGSGSVCCESPCTGSCNSGTCDGKGACQHKPARTACGTVTGSNSENGNDITLLCDGIGNCNGPVIQCQGATACNLSSSFCCNRKTNSQTSVSCSAIPCGTAADLGLGQYGENCRGTADCPIDQICCENQIYGFRWFECQRTCAQFQVCKTQADCIVGTCTPKTGLGNASYCM